MVLVKLVTGLKMTDYTKGGTGKKAPYETVHYRVPKPLKLTVQKLSNTYRNLFGTKYFDELIVNVKETINLTACKGENDTEGITKVGTKYNELKEAVQRWQKGIADSEPGFKTRRADKLFEEITALKWEEGQQTSPAPSLAEKEQQQGEAQSRAE